MDIKSIIVYGAGTMGNGITQVCASSGLDVTMVDIHKDYVDKGMATIRKNIERHAKKERITQDEADAIMGRIKATAERAYDADIVIEAVHEDMKVKEELFADLDGKCPARTILASNTSSIPITEIASVTNRRDRVIGMHFMNPAPLMVGLEIIRGKETSDETFETVKKLARELGKVPGVSNDFPGFVANRILMPYINEGAVALMQGVSDAENIDLIAKKCLNMPMGPLELADMIGLDICMAILEVMHKAFGDDKYAAAPNLRKLVSEGNLGRKTGKGFHTY
jgi:3-hydroxybutyryl-CoA dehydrogenase